MRHLYILIYIMFFGACVTSCSEKKKVEITPWGEEIGNDSIQENKSFTLNDIVSNGELIMLTMSGPETYYDYHGHGMGLQYMLAEKFAQKLGVSLRVEVCKDTLEMVNRLKAGDADIIAFPLLRRYKDIEYCGMKADSLHAQWAVKEGNDELADSLNNWFKPGMIAAMKKEEKFLLSTNSVVHHVYSQLLSKSGGVISRYDNHFKTYAPLAMFDWRLLAAQCYQESTFDSGAHSWAGACGLMQIMPGTADHIGLPRSDMYDPEKNIAAAAKYIRELHSHFRDIPNPLERSYFVLASYNGGFFHVRDAMALARKFGKNPYRWADVQEFVLRLRVPAYYNDPVVKHGYMRGDETVDYVARICNRWALYRGFAHSFGGGFSGGFSGGFDNMTPSRAKHKNRFKI